jgi:hypothetical protein
VLKDFAGFVFNWGDIKETKNTISSLITAGIGAAGDKAGDFEKKVDGFFGDLEKKIDEFAAVGPRISAKQAGGVSDDVSSAGTRASWAQERLKNGGATSSTEVDPSKSPRPPRV